MPIRRYVNGFLIKILSLCECSLGGGDSDFLLEAHLYFFTFYRSKLLPSDVRVGRNILNVYPYNSLKNYIGVTTAKYIR